MENRCYLRQQLLQLDKWENLANEEGRNSLNKRSKSLKIDEKFWKGQKKKKAQACVFAHVYSLKILSENNFHWNKILECSLEMV